jgi:hypothetical protein
MGIDVGHTQMSEDRNAVTPQRQAHLDRLIASLRQSLPLAYGHRHSHRNICEPIRFQRIDQFQGCV